MRKGKHDKQCSICNQLVENSKGVIIPYAIRNFSKDGKNTEYKRVCASCDSQLRSMYGAKQ